MYAEKSYISLVETKESLKKKKSGSQEVWKRVMTLVHVASNLQVYFHIPMTLNERV